ncbi:MAG: hypothetical protein Q4G14_12540 [Paracoccus sp. (in: a-proteobacteria)]|uniref:hypothetical protein n=1 Tax=Paracoccus sp. TaxID=267 RepID=UPI0026E0A5B7|nr:hypothetical protein [Paracoccus sp. (in: a-proteobacteria)]MDO5614052.1 hypothetical protein [Paracoccus sp. (in: a-proteobacteria)]
MFRIAIPLGLILILAACGGSGGGGGTVASPFDNPRQTQMQLAAIGQRADGGTSIISSNAVQVDSGEGTIDAEFSLGYKGKFAQDRWVSDDKGNRIRVSGEGRFVRQVLVAGADGALIAGALGSEATRMPTSGTARYSGSSTGFSQTYVEGQGLVTTEFTGTATMTANLTDGTGSYTIRDVSAATGDAPFHRLSGSLTIEDGGIREERYGTRFVQVSADGPRHNGGFHSANGAFYGPGGAEAGLAYQYRPLSEGAPSLIQGAMTASKQ